MSQDTRRPQLITVTDACFQLSKGRHALYELLRSGEIESCMDGGLRKVFQRSIDAYVERKRRASKQFERAGLRGSKSTTAAANSG